MGKDRDRIIEGFIRDYIRMHGLKISPTLRRQAEAVSEEFSIPYNEAVEIVIKVIKEIVDEVFETLRKEPKGHHHKH